MAQPGDVLWRPPTDVIDKSRIGDYLRWLDRTCGQKFTDYDELWRWSIDDLSGFWSSIWDYFGVADASAARRADTVLTTEEMPGARWFPGATLNYAEYLLRDLPGNDVVLIGRSQTRADVDLTGDQFRDQVARARAGLRRLGVRPGDRVAAYLPNIPETVVLLAATASLGAVFSSCAPEFGTRSVVDRWRQIEPRVLVTVDGYRYGATAIDRLTEIGEIRAALPSLEHVVLLDYLREDAQRDDAQRDDEQRDDEQQNLADVIGWSQLLAEREELAFEPVAFDHPLYVLYSSGTTGLPKPIVHGHGGILLEHLKAHAFHHDVGPGDRFFWFSTTGWMMWNFALSALAVGSAVVCFDGNPAYPDLGALWRLAGECGITFFGTSASFLLACRSAGISPREQADLSRVRAIGSTGSPLPVEGFAWTYDQVHANLMLQSFSGGTDVCTGFVGATPLLKIYAGELSCPCLGAAVAAYDESGHSVVGQRGELVLERPMPSMPVGFWGDTDGSRYRAAYFEHFPGVWRHGDWVTITERGTLIVSGRSDATLNRGGVRLGTAEFYAIVEDIPEVADSLVVHVEDTAGGPGELVLFVVLPSGAELGDELWARIGRELRQNLSPRHLPDTIVAVPDIPRTLSGKKLEVPVKRILEGAPVDQAASTSALANPDALSAFTRQRQSRPAG